MSAIDTILGGLIRPFAKGMSRKSLPQLSGKLKAKGLKAAVSVIRDKQGVPHIEAESIEDAIFAQGFVHAQDRLWQMDLNRRVALGQVSEAFGELALETDIAVRTLGFHRLAEEDWKIANAELKHLIQHYADGINAGIDTYDALPPEFKLLKIKPQKWTALDVIALARMVFWQMSFAWYGELVRAKLIEKVGAEKAAELDVNYSDLNPIELPKGIEFNKRIDGGILEAMEGPFLKPMAGSNAWAISADRSTTGKPILCNDPHLLVTNPGTWYQNHLKAKGLDVAGVSMPGLPFVIIGHNAQVSWGVTLAFTDIHDLFIEKFTSDDLSTYSFQGEERKSTLIKESIKIKGKDKPHVETVVLTHHGPVVSGFLGDKTHKMTIASTALQPTKAYEGLYGFNVAKNWDDFVSSLKHLTCPPLNIVYADVHDNIGYWVTGSVPIRSKGQGLVPQNGWSGDYEWKGMVPFEEMPHSLNPEKGFVLSCNHKVISDSYPHFLGAVWMNGYRARRLTDFFDVKDQLSPADCESMQNDYYSIPGQEMQKHFRYLEFKEPQLAKAKEYLCNWDRILDVNSIGGTIYEVTKHNLFINLVEPVVGEELRQELQGKGFNPAIGLSNTFGGHDTVAILRLLNTPDSWWIQQAGGAEKLLRKSLLDAVKFLSKEHGPNPENWKWGKLHAAELPHVLGIKKPLDKVFNLGPYPMAGDADTPHQTASSLYNDDYGGPEVMASWRQIIDLADLSKSVCIMPPGQSGQLKSKYYADQMQDWLDGKYYPYRWTAAQIEADADERMTLEP